MEGMVKMEFIKGLAIFIYIVICIAIIVLTFLQSKQSAGASGTIVGGESSEGGNFYEKIKAELKKAK